MGKTKRGKGTKLMAVTERAGVPLGVHAASASPAEITLVQDTLATVKVPGKHGRAPWCKPVRLIADSLRISLWSREIESICPHRAGRKQSPLQDGRPPRRSKRRWTVERTIA